MKDVVDAPSAPQKGAQQGDVGDDDDHEDEQRRSLSPALCMTIRRH